MWKLFVFIVLLEIALNFTMRDTFECIKDHYNVVFWLILHHISNCFLNYGWLFNNMIILSIHLLTTISTLIYWLSNSNLCDLTVYVNKICGWDENASFKDLLYMSGIKSIPFWNKIWHYVFIILSGCISIYKIRRNIVKK